MGDFYHASPETNKADKKKKRKSTPLTKNLTVKEEKCGIIA